VFLVGDGRMGSEVYLDIEKLSPLIKGNTSSISNFFHPKKDLFSKFNHNNLSVQSPPQPTAMAPFLSTCGCLSEEWRHSGTYSG